MITVEEAKAKVEGQIKVLEIEERRLSKAFGYVLAKDLKSKTDIPGFPQSAMDGYAVEVDETIEKGTKFKVVGELQAGDTEMLPLGQGEALRIFTGAPAPENANTIIIQEVVDRQGDTIEVRKTTEPGINLRARGEQIRKGEIGLSKGTELTPAAIGFAAMMGHDTVRGYRKPEIHLLVTGNELVEPGKSLQFGQIYESNAIALSAAIRKYFELEVHVHKVKDSYGETLESLKNILTQADLVMASGGISVGDYDFVGKALHELGVEEIFYKVKQKPGKPLFFGLVKGTPVMALPGNPASALTGFYQYVLPSIRKMVGAGFRGLREEQRVLKNDFHKRGTRAMFLKAFANEKEVEILEGQSSAMMHTYAISNALVYIPWDKEFSKAGEEVVVYFLD
ncbi:MAG TPA: molybdopterin molybdenumtransferase MoeA [Flavobacteriales bacterium]|jgi:molybdopterin molybdotransferase|nr:molybdopterin molybdenumtransferase MoeA [Flavobacteriales bacterium]